MRFIIPLMHRAEVDQIDRLLMSELPGQGRAVSSHSRVQDRFRRFPDGTEHFQDRIDLTKVQSSIDPEPWLTFRLEGTTWVACRRRSVSQGPKALASTDRVQEVFSSTSRLHDLTFGPRCGKRHYLTYHFLYRS